MDSSRKGIEKRIQPTKFRPPKIQILYLGVESFITILMPGDFRTTPFARLISSIFYQGFSKEIDHLSNPGFCKLQNISEKDLKFIGSSSKGIQVPERVLERAAPEKHRGSILEYFI